MEQAKDRIRRTLGEVKGFLNQEASPSINEADTKAFFIEPLILALGWSGFGIVTREYYVKNSQEFIDFVMSGPDGPLLAIETKALRAGLTDKNAAQLIQYCSVEGIEWAALTNGRELQFFNTFLKPDLSAKRILSLDLLAFNSDAEFDALFAQIWQLSRESMTTPTGVRTWLNQRRVDTALRSILLNPSSGTIRLLRRALADLDIRATPQDLTQWFRSHLNAPITTLPAQAPHTEAATFGQSPRPDASQVSDRPSQPGTSSQEMDGPSLAIALREAVVERWPDTRWRETKYYVAGEVGGETFIAYRVRRQWLFVGITLPEEHDDARVASNDGRFNWRRITKVLYVRDFSDIDDGLLSLIASARAHVQISQRSSTYHGVTIVDLIAAGLVTPGTELILKAGQRELATATLSANGEIVWNGIPYRSPSDKAFAQLLSPTRTTLNGWTHWSAVLPTGQARLSDLREQLLAIRESDSIIEGEAG